MPTQEEAFKYISYATMRETWDAIKAAFVAWVIISVFCIVIGGLMDAGILASQALWSDVPRPLLYIAGFAAFSWFFRGKEIRFVLPSTFRLWLLTVTFVAVVVSAAAVLPSWALIPIYFGLIVALFTLDSLARIGKANYERLAREQTGIESGEA